ncbi:MAG: hypothetical protein ACRC5S_02955 [Cetobacterium sp.]
MLVTTNIKGYEFIEFSMSQKKLTDNGIEKINNLIDKKFKNMYKEGFGGVLQSIMVTTQPFKNFNALSLVFTCTIGGKNNFFVKNKLDYIQKTFEDILDTKFTEVIIQVPKEIEKKEIIE